ncbi:hypothetical protein [Streptomyces sp. NPDC002671]
MPGLRPDSESEELGYRRRVSGPLAKQLGGLGLLVLAEVDAVAL